MHGVLQTAEAWLLKPPNYWHAQPLSCMEVVQNLIPGHCLLDMLYGRAIKPALMQVPLRPLWKEPVGPESGLPGTY